MKTFRLSEIIGLPILVVDVGENAGEVKDLVFDLVNKKILALILKPGGLSLSKAIPFDSIKKIGKDAISVESRDVFVKIKTLASERVAFGNKLVGSRAFCEDGEELGTLEDLVVCVDDGNIIEVEVSRNWLSTISQGYMVLPGSSIKSVGKDTILFSSGAENEARQTGGAKEMFQAAVSKSTRLSKNANLALISKETKYALGKVSGKTIKGAEGDIIVAKGQKIEEEHILRAKDEGKLHELALAAGFSFMKEKWSRIRGGN